MRYTGIIRTLPTLYADSKNLAFKRMFDSYEHLAAGRIPAIYIALSQKPKIEVLHLYVLVSGLILCRMNIAGYLAGSEAEAFECWDGEYRAPNWWAECSAPVSFPPEPIKRRGFQGFRYTEDLW